MSDVGLDYAGRSPGAAAVKAAGYQFVARYLSRYTSKVITKAEYDDMTNNGVGVVVVFEDYANQALKGYAQGVSDVQFALDQANGIGWPADRPIYFAVDFDISDAQKPAVGEYFKGVASVIGIGRTGGYGGYWLVKYLFDSGLITYGWQAVAWSGGNREARAHLFQRLGGVTVNGTQCDVNDALKADYGQNNTNGGTDMTRDEAAEISLYARIGIDFESVAEANTHAEDDINHIVADPAYAGGLMKALKEQGANWPKAADLLVNFDKYQKAAYDNGFADGKATVPPVPIPTPTPDPAPNPAPDPTPTPDPVPGTPAQSFVDKAIKWLKTFFGVKGA